MTISLICVWLYQKENKNTRHFVAPTKVYSHTSSWLVSKYLFLLKNGSHLGFSSYFEFCNYAFLHRAHCIDTLHVLVQFRIDQNIISKSNFYLWPLLVGSILWNFLLVSRCMSAPILAPLVLMVSILWTIESEKERNQKRKWPVIL